MMKKNIIYGLLLFLVFIGCQDRTSIKVEVKNDIDNRVVPSDETTYWTELSKSSLDKIWNNKEDDIYNELV